MTEHTPSETDSKLVSVLRRNHPFSAFAQFFRKNIYRQYLLTTVFLLFFAVLGVHLTFFSHAAPFASSAEAEHGTLSGAAVVCPFSTASNGHAVEFGTTSCGGSVAPSGSGKLFGYSTHILEQQDPANYIALAENDGATTIRDDDAFQMGDTESSKGTYDWTSSDQLMTYAVKDKLHVLMLTDTVASWSGVSDPADFGAFVGKLAARYGPGGAFWNANPSLPKVYPAGIEIWNEENLDKSTPPATYTALLKAAYTAVRAVYPAPDGITTMPVVLGGIAPAGGYNDVECTGATNNPQSGGVYNGVNYLQDVYKDGAAGYFDALGWHPYNYNNGDTADDMLSYNSCSGWSQMDATSPSAVSLMQQYGDGKKKIWITEAGAPTCLTGGGSTYGCVSEAQQSILAADELTVWKKYPWAGNYYWYDLRDDGGGASTSDDQQHFGSVRGVSNIPANGGVDSLKPVYMALKNAFTSP